MRPDANSTEPSGRCAIRVLATETPSRSTCRLRLRVIHVTSFLSLAYSLFDARRCWSFAGAFSSGPMHACLPMAVAIGKRSLLPGASDVWKRIYPRTKSTHIDAPIPRNGRIEVCHLRTNTRLCTTAAAPIWLMFITWIRLKSRKSQPTEATIMEARPWNGIV